MCRLPAISYHHLQPGKSELAYADSSSTTCAKPVNFMPCACSDGYKTATIPPTRQRLRNQPFRQEVCKHTATPSTSFNRMLRDTANHLIIIRLGECRRFDWPAFLRALGNRPDKPPQWNPRRSRTQRAFKNRAQLRRRPFISLPTCFVSLPVSERSFSAVK